MNQAQARRLFRLAEDAINRLDLALFATEEADALGLVEADERQKALRQLILTGDALLAFSGLDGSAVVLLDQVKTAFAEAKAKPFDVVVAASDHAEESETEIYKHPIVFRDLLGRISAIYALDPSQIEQGLSIAQGQLLTICRNFPASIQMMLSKNIIDVPRGEHDVKHLLFSIVRASFTDAVPDGSVAFAGEYRRHRPDFGIPRLKCCVETKVARDRPSISSAIDGIIADQSNYGSDEYKIFIGVIYTSDDTLTKEQFDKEIADRTAKGGEPSFEWHWVLTHGPLSPSISRAAPSPSYRPD
ncbi:hypothetical protein MKK84_00385 [Methylobacterium sp. E-065]|uniref:PD-(D/E)XK nuclease domain-containing protein n=1 Tax=Methylobacterium sp. E-065 TaxID=2836583 RepID=UPI001FBA99F4|nr:hypothetical protein [Methylobacterium sp. E-065]MCJ2015898.1 hypothetical protein [Methylobacterium sp. E-065]